MMALLSSDSTTEAIMNNNVIRSTHPLVIIAAISLTLFSLAGVAALMGWLPSSKGHEAEAIGVPMSQSRPVQPAPLAKSVPAPQAKAAQPAPRSTPRYEPRYEPRETVFRDEPRRVEPPVVAQAEPRIFKPAPVKPVCHDCGVIETVRTVETPVKPSGVGAAAGGVLGGVLGHQMGNGRGRDLMTVVGAVGGAVAGHQVEKRTRKTTSYEIVVRLDDGTTRTLSEPQAPAWRAGDRVRLVGDDLRAAETM
jgi:outer membrane lipoprotein SlyB